MNKKKKVGKELYYLAIGLLFTVVIISILPIFFEKASVVFQTAYLKIVFAILSLAIALVTFGLIGDSEALLKSKKKNGIYFQVTGSAAGFLIFYYLLTSGLSPYGALTIYLYKDKQNILNPSDGNVEVALAGLTKRSIDVRDGVATFAYVPKFEKFRILISGGLWHINQKKPDKCFDEQGNFLPKCKLVNLYLEKKLKCLEDISLTQYEKTEVTTNLEIFLSVFADNIRFHNPENKVVLCFSDKVLQAKVHKIKFKIKRNSTGNRNVGAHLSTIEGWFNRTQNKKLIKIKSTCDTIFVKLVNEDSVEGGDTCS